MNKAIQLLVIVIVVAVAIAAVGFAMSFWTFNAQPQATPSPEPTLPSQAIPKEDNVTVSGIVTAHGLPIPPTEVSFVNIKTQEVYKAPIDPSSHSYIIFLPGNQIYGIEGDWNGRTFNATGLPMGAISMRLDNGSWVLNLNNSSGSITQNLLVGMWPGEPTLTPKIS